jgi:dephospho-CoA kinase
MIAIMGLPGSGKTTLAATMGLTPVVNTDEFRNLPWADAPAAVMLAIEARRPEVVEGITVARLFRRGFKPRTVIHCLGGINMPSIASLIKRGLREVPPGTQIIEVNFFPERST